MAERRTSSPGTSRRDEAYWWDAGAEVEQMRRLLGWVLILWPAGLVLQGLVGTVAAAVTGGYGEGELGEAVLLLGMGTLLALLPIGLGVVLVRGPRRARDPGPGLPPAGLSTRELVGWALVLPAALSALVWAAGLFGSRPSGPPAGLAGVVQVLVLGALLATGVWLIVTERRHWRSIRARLRELDEAP